MSAADDLRRSKGTRPPESGRALDRLPGLRSKIAAARKLAMRQVLVQRLRRLAEREDRSAGDRAFADMLMRATGDPLATQVLVSATLRGARNAEARSDLLAAARFWVWHAKASGESDKSARNLARCGRGLTKDRNDRASAAAALKAWNLLLEVDPQSADARQGIAWCHAAMARWSEQESDFSAAREHWSAVLKLLPEDEAANDGVRRALESGAVPATPGDGDSARSSRARALYEHLKRVTRPDYGSQCAAGKLLLESGGPELAMGFLEEALAKKRGPEAELLLFRCCVAIRRFPEAAGLLQMIVKDGRLAAAPASDVRALLAQVVPGSLSADLVSALAEMFSGTAEVAPVLLPHLVAHGFHAAVSMAVDVLLRTRSALPDSIVLQTASYLAVVREEERALRLLARSAGSPEIAAAFARQAQAFDPERLEHLLLADRSEPTHSFCASCLVVAEHFAASDASRATSVLCRIKDTGEAASRTFYNVNKKRLAALIGQLLATNASAPEIRQALAGLVVTWLPESVISFFGGSEFESLRDAFVTGSRFSNAPAASRTGIFREQYFTHHMERRENQPVESFVTDFAFCDAALRYFNAIDRMQPLERIPVSIALRERLAKPCLALGNGRTADLLMSYAILRERPEYDLKSDTVFEILAGWFVTTFLNRNSIPAECLSPDLLNHFNAVTRDHAALGIAVTRFTELLWQRGDAKDRLHLGNPLDALLFTLEAIVTQLSANRQFRPFFAAMMPSAAVVVPTFLDACIAALASGANGGSSFPAALAYRIEANPIVPLPADTSLRQDVLLIGHGGQGSGLGRNFRMIAEALTGPDIALTTMNYDSDQASFGEELQRWRGTCRSRPIVVTAINAHDVPALFIRDRHNVLEDCRLAGFFLWETSQAPRVQHLGIALVDEIWAPTRYVAEVYAPLRETHVVGKGLFAPGGWQVSPRAASPATIRFLTVFDFHSSIERKNPVASVLAFQKAFPNGEDVELIVKASNVNPQHPGNASRQWERLCAASAGDRRIRLVTARYSEEEMRQLMRETSCVVSLHRSEGFGYVLSDAMALGIPVLATDYSGNVDFCDPETSFPVSFRPIPVRSHGAHWEGEGTVWADPDIDSAAAQMRRVQEDYRGALAKAAAGRQAILKKYSTAAFAAALRGRIAVMTRHET